MPRANETDGYLKTALYLAVFILVYGAILAYYAFSLPPALDENGALDRIKRSPTAFDTPDDYFYAIDHPALFHWVDRAILAALRVPIGDIPKLNLNESYDWNVEHGRIAPRRPVNVLRAANVVTLAAALLMLFFLARFLFGGYIWGFVVAAPLAIPTTLGTGVGGYIKSDAHLAFFFALTLYLWVRFHYAARPTTFLRVIIMGIVIGLAISAKLNAGLLFLAYLAYLVITARGVDKAWVSLVFALTAFTVFVAVNPVLQRGGLEGALAAIADMFRQRQRTYELHRQWFGTMTAADRILFMFPQWYLLAIFALVVAHARRERWFLPVILWSSFLIIGTALTVEQRFERYLMPIDFGLGVAVAFSATAIFRRLRDGQVRLIDLLKG